MLAVSSLATYGILLAGLLKSPLIMKIINSKLDEFQELLKISRFEAKHILSVDIFYLLCIIIYSTFSNNGRSTTSRRRGLIKILHCFIRLGGAHDTPTQLVSDHSLPSSVKRIQGLYLHSFR